MNKARKISIPLVSKLINETSPIQKRQISDRIALAIKIESLINRKNLQKDRDKVVNDFRKAFEKKVNG